MVIPKLNLDEFKKNNKGHKLLIECEDTEIRRLPNGEVLKILDNILLELLSNTGFSLEKRLDEVDNLTSFTNFAMPNRKLEENGIVNSYTMPYVPGVDLSKVGSINPFTGRVITLDYIFSTINLQDLNIMQKVWKLFQQSVPNEFLGDDIYVLAEQYNLVELPGAAIKRLVRK